MTNIFADFRRVVLAAIEDLVANRELPPGLDLRRVAVEPPRDPAHGDLATNAAMVLPGIDKAHSMALAERIAAALMVRAPWCTTLDTSERRCLLGLLRKMIRLGGR